MQERRKNGMPLDNLLHPSLSALLVLCLVLTYQKFLCSLYHTQLIINRLQKSKITNGIYAQAPSGVNGCR